MTGVFTMKSRTYAPVPPRADDGHNLVLELLGKVPYLGPARKRVVELEDRTGHLGLVHAKRERGAALVKAFSAGPQMTVT